MCEPHAMYKRRTRIPRGKSPGQCKQVNQWTPFKVQLLHVQTSFMLNKLWLKTLIRPLNREALLVIHRASLGSCEKLKKEGGHYDILHRRKVLQGSSHM